jgi:hypothetical protein
MAKIAVRSNPAGDVAQTKDAHMEVYGKVPEDVVYHDERCPVCNTRIDEFGFCSCGAGLG